MSGDKVTAGSETVNAWNQLVEQVRLQLGSSNLDNACSTALRALEVAEAFPPDDRRQGVTLELATEALFANQKFKLCAPLMVRLLEMYKRCLGPEHIDTSTIMHNLAMLYHQQGRLGQADALYRSAIEIKAKELGDQHEEVDAIRAQQESLRQPAETGLTESRASLREKLNRTGQQKALRLPPDEEFMDFQT